MAFNDTYRESIQDKHSGNVGFTSTAKGLTNEGYPTKNPHQVVAGQIPVIDVVGTHGPLTASGIAAGLVEQHTVQLTADPTVNNNLAWIAYESDCTEAGHSARGAIRLDTWMRVAETQYKLRLYADTGSNAPDYGTEILPSEVAFNWEYDASAGSVYFDSDPLSTYTGRLWGVFYRYIGETVQDKLDTTVSGAGGYAYAHLTDGLNTHDATPDDTIQFTGQGGAQVSVDATTGTVTISGTSAASLMNVDFGYNTGVWEYAGGFTSVPTDLQVFLNGNKNRDDAEYYTATVAAGTMTIDFDFPTHSHDWVNCTWSHPIIAGGEMHDWQEVITSVSLNNRDRVIVNTSATGSNGVVYTLTLPPAPQTGETICFIDGGGNCSTTNVILSRNGNNIMGLADDLDIDSDNASFSLVYYNAAQGWRLMD